MTHLHFSHLQKKADYTVTGCWELPGKVCNPELPTLPDVDQMPLFTTVGIQPNLTISDQNL